MNRTAFGMTAAETNAELPRFAHDAALLARLGFTLSPTQRGLGGSSDCEAALARGLIRPRRAQRVDGRGDTHWRTVAHTLTKAGRSALQQDAARTAAGGAGYLYSLGDYRRREGWFLGCSRPSNVDMRGVAIEPSRVKVNNFQLQLSIHLAARVTQEQEAAAEATAAEQRIRSARHARLIDFVRSLPSLNQSAP